MQKLCQSFTLRMPQLLLRYKAAEVRVLIFSTLSLGLDAQQLDAHVYFITIMPAPCSGAFDFLIHK